MKPRRLSRHNVEWNGIHIHINWEPQWLNLKVNHYDVVHLDNRAEDRRQNARRHYLYGRVSGYEQAHPVTRFLSRYHRI